MCMCLFVCVWGAGGDLLFMVGWPAYLNSCTRAVDAEGVKVEFTPCAIKELSSFSAKVNASSEDIGARRLHTVVSKVGGEYKINT